MRGMEGHEGHRDMGHPGSLRRDDLR